MGKRGIKALTVGRAMMVLKCLGSMGIRNRLVVSVLNSLVVLKMSWIVGRIVLAPVGNGMISNGTPLMCVGLAVLWSLLVLDSSFQIASCVVEM